MLLQHQLAFDKCIDHFRKSLEGINLLSDAILSVCDFTAGDFYTILPQDVSAEELYDFRSGGKSNPLRKEFSRLIERIFLENHGLISLFDDFNSSWPDIENDGTYTLCGRHLEKEVYYLLEGTPSSESVLHLLRRSTTLWHSLCVVSFLPGGLPSRELSRGCLEKLAKGCRFVFMFAYDDESYVFWKRREI